MKRHRKIAPWTVALPTFLACLAFAASASAAFPGGNGLLAFGTNRDGNDEIYTMNGDGTGPIRLTNNTAFDARPAWSANGQRIVFESYRDGNPEIYVMNANGSSQTRLTNTAASDMEPAWSPDGNKIVFSTSRTGDFELYTMNADGTAQTPLTADSTNDLHPDWSPDGQTIAFMKPGNAGYDLWTMPASGGAGTNQTSTPGSSESYPDWSPDGTKIVFSWDAGGDHELYTMNANGSNVTPLTNTPESELEAAWAPDGTKIAFSRSGDIYVMNANGTGATALTSDTNTISDASPDWQPFVDTSGYPRPAGASPVRVPLVPAYRACTSSNRLHGPPLAFASCNPPDDLSSHLTVGTPDANGAPAKSLGYLKFRVSPGLPGPPHDTQTRLDVELTDVRCAGGTSTCGPANVTGGPDYAGELAGRIVLRITDRDNGFFNSQAVPATMTDYTLRYRVSCAATPDTSVGSVCSLHAAPDSEVPGITPEGKRSIWETQTVQIDDGGPDGVASTLDNTPFVTQGLFVP